MVQKSFGIYSNKQEDCHLFIEVGERHLACWTLSVEDNAWNAFELFQFQNTPDEQSFEVIFAEVKLHAALIGKTYQSTKVIWENADALCVPNPYFTEDLIDDYIQTVIGNKPNTVSRSAQVSDIKLLYLVNAQVLKIITDQFPGAEHFHKQQLFLSKGPQPQLLEAYHGQVYLLFYEGHFLMAVYKQKQLQLIRSFDYQTPEDVVYHLLNMSALLGLELSTTIFIVAGLIDLDSSLFTELYKYIPVLQMEKAADGFQNNEVFSEFPAHYFTPFFKYVV